MKIELGAGTQLNIARLIETKMLLQANSGGGKSWALRRILEQSHGQVQQIVIDIEDEFYTLRERFDYILVRREGGDCVPDVRSAALLATRLLELGVSAIISIFEMSHHERREFVRGFMEALTEAPKTLWHPMLLVLDEAHRFCEEKGRGAKDDSGCADAVINFMAQGRKRGFCAILATQRISKLNKDAAAEANKLIDRAALDVDMKRAGEELGFTSKEDQHALRQLKPGEFFAFGPALSDTVKRVKVGDVQTTHPKAGAGVTPIAPAKTKVLSVLKKLGDLPREAEAERQTMATLQRDNAELRREISSLRKSAESQAVKVETKEVPAISDKQFERLEVVVAKLDTFCSKEIPELIGRANDLAKPLRAVLVARGSAAARNEDAPAYRVGNFPRSGVPLRTPHETTGAVERARVHDSGAGTTGGAGGVRIGEGEMRVLTAIAQHAPEGVTREQLSVLTAFKRSTRDAYIQRLRTKGLVEAGSDRVVATDAGVEALGADFMPLPTGVDLQKYWLARLPEGERRVLECALAVYPGTFTREGITEETGYKRSTRDAYLQRLRSRRLVDFVRAGEVAASGQLFD